MQIANPLAVKRSATEDPQSLWATVPRRREGLDGPYCAIRVARVPDAYLVIGQAILDEALPALIWTLSSIPIAPGAGRSAALEANAAALRHARLISHLRIVAIDLLQID
jgi:hypothetical protein